MNSLQQAKNADLVELEYNLAPPSVTEVAKNIVV